MAGVTLIPLGWVVWSTAQLGLRDAVDFLARPRVGELLWNTVRLLGATVALSAVLGVGCAWLVALASFYLIEKPSLKLRDRLLTPRKREQPAEPPAQAA